MILRAPEIQVGENQLTDVMLNLINENQIRFKLKVDDMPYDFYVRNWYMEMKGLAMQLVISGMEVPSKKPVQLTARFDVLKKSVMLGGIFMDQKVHIKTTGHELFAEFVKLLRK